MFNCSRFTVRHRKLYKTPGIVAKKIGQSMKVIHRRKANNHYLP